ncbi:response regulator transcription factor [Microbacterium sp. MPKO10]|uniref:response regulator n=1 Tax=Microbacterium sp. MPKO10 TaxID=2989818 RepID=UPI0022367A77|nr:response regulator transcription factor [Microbacterium sp. MPKO10]MCW4457012.1 response regulator transcription factor [Microbacterium sp. MPKO10]
MTRVLLVDDQDLVRAGLRTLLENDPELTVVAEARNGREAVAKAREYAPDVVLMDLRMPEMDGIEATRVIRRDPALSDVRVLVLTTFDEDDDIIEAIRNGAAGYLLKDTPAADLRAAVHTVADGGNLLSPAILGHVMEYVAATPKLQAKDPRLDELTEREYAVLSRLAYGESNAEIARSLYISPATARTYVSRILTKMGVQSRTELAVIAHRSGLGDIDRS